jgi:hypothetical protein
VSQKPKRSGSGNRADAFRPLLPPIGTRIVYRYPILVWKSWTIILRKLYGTRNIIHLRAKRLTYGAMPTYVIDFVIEHVASKRLYRHGAATSVHLSRGIGQGLAARPATVPGDAACRHEPT